MKVKRIIDILFCLVLITAIVGIAWWVWPLLFPPDQPGIDVLEPSNVDLEEMLK